MSTTPSRGLTLGGGKVVSVTLATGQTVSCGTLVNAAGPRAQQVAAMAGLSIPVEPRKRYSFVFASAVPIPGRMPNVIDLSGTFVRPEGELFLAGNTPQRDGPADYDDFAMVHAEFDDHIWPALWHRIPSFDALRVQQSWTGHYEYNTLDHNGIVGFHPRVTNFMFANGFSGHGLQQSPAVGRAVSELIVHGAFQTLDLTPLPLRADRAQRAVPRRGGDLSPRNETAGIGRVTTPGGWPRRSAERSVHRAPRSRAPRRR